MKRIVQAATSLAGLPLYIDLIEAIGLLIEAIGLGAAVP
jgi:hypothetical protein